MKKWREPFLCEAGRIWRKCWRKPPLLWKFVLNVNRHWIELNWLWHLCHAISWLERLLKQKKGLLIYTQICKRMFYIKINENERHTDAQERQTRHWHCVPERLVRTLRESKKDLVGRIHTLPMARDTETETKRMYKPTTKPTTEGLLPWHALSAIRKSVSGDAIVGMTERNGGLIVDQCIGKIEVVLARMFICWRQRLTWMLTEPDAKSNSVWLASNSKFDQDRKSC